MKQVHLFEFEDLEWFPDLFRGFITDILEYQLKTFDVYTPLVPKIQEIIDRTHSTQIIDLCSGSAGPWPQIYSYLTTQKKTISIILTDKYPNIKTFVRIKNLSHAQIAFVFDSIDASNVPYELTGFRTLFTSFHHFRPELAQKIIKHSFYSSFQMEPNLLDLFNIHNSVFDVCLRAI